MENCWTRASDIGWLLRQSGVGLHTRTDPMTPAKSSAGGRPGRLIRARPKRWIGCPRDSREPTSLVAQGAAGSLGAEDDAAVGGEAEARVVGDLPSVPIEVTEDAGVPAVECLGGLSGDGSAGLAGSLDHGVDLFG